MTLARLAHLLPVTVPWPEAPSKCNHDVRFLGPPIWVPSPALMKHSKIPRENTVGQVSLLVLMQFAPESQDADIGGLLPDLRVTTQDLARGRPKIAGIRFRRF